MRSRKFPAHEIYAETALCIEEYFPYTHKVKVHCDFEDSVKTVLMTGYELYMLYSSEGLDVPYRFRKYGLTRSLVINDC